MNVTMYSALCMGSALPPFRSDGCVDYFVTPKEITLFPRLFFHQVNEMVLFTEH